MLTALGFRAHSGWAAMVAVGRALQAPRVLARHRVIIADPGLQGSKQPYHLAAQMPLSRAEVLVRKAIESSRALALEALSASVEVLGSQGHEVVACGLLLGSGKVLPRLEGILASHALIHAAEGEMFRDVLSWAALECNLPVTTVREKELPIASLHGITSLGKLLGPPWTHDQKYAILAALKSVGERAKSSRVLSTNVPI